MPIDRFHLRLATVDDSDEIARLLHGFNTEFDTPTPAVSMLSARLQNLLAGTATFAILVESPAVALALVTLRPNVWYHGPVALLDELYVVPDRRNEGIGSTMLSFLMTECRTRRVGLIEINVDEGDVDAQRFYERHGYSSVEDATGERAFYYFSELSGDA